MSASRISRMASVALDDGGLKRQPSKEKGVALEGTRNLHLNPGASASFMITETKPSGSLPREAREEEALSEDVDEEEEDPDSVYDCFSTRNPLSRWSANFFGGTPTPAYMSMFALGLFLVMTFQNLTADSRSAAVAFIIYFLINTALLVAVFLVRWMWLWILYWLFEENRIVPALNEMTDPDLPILIWTLIMQMIWVSNMAQVFDDDGRKTGYHRIRFVPDDWPFQSIKDKHVTYLKLMQFVLMFWALRNMLVEIIMFNILLGFLTNFRDSVLSYLGEYALLRKLNANWVKVVPPTEPPGEGTPGQPSAPAVQPAAGGLIRRRSSLSLAFEEAVVARKPGEMSVGEQPPNAKLARHSSVWERKKRRKDRAVHVEHTGRELPTVLQNKNIKAVKQSALANLLSITFIRMSPMVLFVHGERCELKSRRVAKAVARLLFREIQDFQTAVNQINQELQKTMMGDEAFAFAAFQSPGGLMPPPGGAGGGGAPSPDISDPGPARSPFAPKSPGVFSPEGLKEQRGKVKINISEPKVTFTDRLAAELGVRNEEGLEDDETDEDVSDGENFKNIQEAVEGKQAPIKIPTPVVTPLEVRSVPVIDPEPRPQRAQVRRRTAPGLSAEKLVGERISAEKLFDFHQPHLEKQKYERLESEAGDTSVAKKAPRKQFSSTSAHGSSMRRSHSLTSESDSLEAFAESEAPLMNLHQGQSNPKQPKVHMRMTQDEVNRVVEAEIRLVNKRSAANKKHITKEFFSVFMSKAETESLMAVMDPGKNGAVSEKMFVKGVLNVHQKRRQMCSSLEAQKEIIGVFHRVTTYFLSFIIFLIFLLIAGVGTNTIIVSGAAALSASGVVLSFVYTDFIISIILIVFLNPYSIGDGIVLDGVFMTVRRITTYFTECVQGDGKIFYVSHKKLTESGIINQSRGSNACFGLTVRVGDHMTAAQYAAFKRVIEAYLKSRPEMYKPGLFIHWLALEPWHFIDLNMWITGMEGWAAPGTWIAKSDLFAFVLRQTHLLGLTYKGVIQRWQMYEEPAEDKRNAPGSGEAGRLVASETQHGLPPPSAGRYPMLLHEAQHSHVPPAPPPPSVMFLDLTKPLDPINGQGHVSFM